MESADILDVEWHKEPLKEERKQQNEPTDDCDPVREAGRLDR